MTKKRRWSKEARERQSIRMKERFGVNRDPLPSIVREREYREMPLEERLPKEMDMKTDKYIAKRDFDYDTGIKFEQGEVVELRGLPNDSKLISLGYMINYSTRGDEDTCIKCSKIFGSTSGYMRHTASHYEVCSQCGRKVAPEDMNKHREAHAVLA